MRAVVLSLLVTCACTASDSRVDAQQTARVDGPAGVSLRLPPGWSAGARDAVQLQLLPGDPAVGEAVVVASTDAQGVTTLTDPAVIRSTEAEMQRLFPLLQRVGAPTTLRTGLGEGVRLEWEGRQPDGTAVRLSAHLALHQGQIVTMIAVGPPANLLARREVLAALFGSMAPTPSTPEVASGPAPAAGKGLHDGSRLARTWVDRLRGKQLTRLSGYNSGGGSGGMTSRADLVLAADGRFRYTSSSSVSMSVDGMGGSSSGRESAEGQWRITSRGGRALLELRYANGTREEGELTREETRTFLNGGRVFVTEP